MITTKLVDFSAKKTEAEWIQVVDRFWLCATPETFKWLSWVGALAALTYVAQRSGGIVRHLPDVYVWAMFFYYNAFFFQFVFVNPPIVRSIKGRRFISLVLSGLLAYGTTWLARVAITIIAGMKP